VVFDEGSGDTHLLDPLAAEVLKALAEAPVDLVTLHERLATRFGLTEDSGVRAHVAATIGRFRDLGLAERVRG
jgi:PqqD family protein of HPr-rel-A system